MCIRELIERYSIVQQLGDIIFTNHQVDEFEAEEVHQPKAPSTTYGNIEKVELTEEIGARLKELRVATGHNQSQFTRLMGSNPFMVNKIEFGRGNITKSILKLYCDTLGVDVDDILNGNDISEK